ncbi:hypothetical protein RFI_18809 [Reticulomyxa filosa]|uniref:Uncharacterized protein n=1 Tax=Reticulomyxa filosa TaxID=46433 RepID=X6MYB2_RETFI|nr:hypothetical protein RFI_18809 [Reticulomyxa filosa]|eukprot:ETO18457.1 hypothetical protein RFI_18809 [Reticulomyxa filosa]
MAMLLMCLALFCDKAIYKALTILDTRCWLYFKQHLNLVLAVIVDTYSQSVKTVQGETDLGNTIQEIDILIQSKLKPRPRASTSSELTVFNYEKQMQHLKITVRRYEKVFKEFGRPIVELTEKKHELVRKTKLRVNTGWSIYLCVIFLLIITIYNNNNNNNNND